jgi:hypothetical protein
MGVVPQQGITYNLVSDNSQARLLYTFADGNLQMIQVLENEGALSPSRQATAPNAFAAEAFLSNYQSYTGDQLYGNLKSTLDSVDGRKNLTLSTIVNP